MTTRQRVWVVAAISLFAGAALGRVSRWEDWSDLTFYAGEAGLITVIGLVGLPWIEFARDGAFRRPPGGCAPRPRRG